MRTVIAIIERGDDGTYGVHSPELENVIIGSGDTVAEAKEDFENSYHEVVDNYIDKHLVVPKELCDIEFEYRYSTTTRMPSE